MPFLSQDKCPGLNSVEKSFIEKVFSYWDSSVCKGRVLLVYLSHCNYTGKVMLVFFPVWTSYQSQSVLHWQKSLLCWRDSLHLNQVVSKCFITEVNASNFTRNFTLCLSENPKLLYACYRLNKKCRPLVTENQLWEKDRPYWTSTSSVVIWSCGEGALCWESANTKKYLQKSICVGLFAFFILSPTWCFCSLFPSLLKRFLFK